MNPALKSQQRSTQVGACQVVELWGDGPIFPGPGWRLNWNLANEEQHRFNATLSSGQLWSFLESKFTRLSGLPDLWKTSQQNDDQQEALPLRAVTALADLLLQPAQLIIDKPYTFAQLKTSFLVLRSDQHDLAGDALKLSSALTLAAYLNSRGVKANLQPLQRTMEAFIRNVAICCEHSLTNAQLSEARRRGIPAFLIDPTQRFYQLGTGVHSRWISSTSNDRDSAFGVAIAKSKSTTHDLLGKLGLPVARELRLPHNVSEEQLIKAANLIGYPCVLKPNNAEQGRGATANIESESELLDAAQKARQFSRNQILLQEHINGHDHRLNIVQGVLKFVIKRSAPAITGDGKSTALELIQKQNVAKRHIRNEDGISTEIDPASPEVLAMLHKAATSLTSIPKEGEIIQLGKTANISTGGLRHELDIAEVHPKIRQQGEIIAHTLGLDVCGIDYICEDITKDPDISPGAFIEINSMPQNAPSRAGAIIDNLFPNSKQVNVECIIIIANWEQADPTAMKARLSKEIGSKEQAILSFAKHLTPKLLPLLPDPGSANIHIYKHPREAMLHKTTECVIYLTTPARVMSQGLPSALPSKILAWTNQGDFEQANLWKEFLGRHCKPASAIEIKS